MSNLGYRIHLFQYMIWKQPFGKNIEKYIQVSPINQK